MTEAGALDFFAPGMAVRALLLGTRVSAMMLVAPAISATVVPQRARVAIAVLLTLLMLPAASRLAPSPVLTVPALATEVAVGLLLGAGAAMLVVAAEIAGDVMSINIGLSGASLLDPLQGVSTLVLTPLVRLTALMLLLSLNLHATMLGALADSLETVPLGTWGHLASGLDAALHSVATLFLLGVQFAAPVIGTALMVTLALGLLTRAAPQFNPFAIAFPVLTGVGLMTVGTAITAMAYSLSHWRTPYHDLVARVLGQLTTG